MKNFFFFFLFSFFFFLFSFSQNLVPNPSFEDTVSCPTGTGQIYKALPWYSANNGTPDYFNTCISSFLSVPSNFVGYQNPRTGNAYAGFSTYFGNGREYVEVQLDSALKAGQKYCILFHVSLANISNDAIDTLGAFLSNNSIFVSTENPLPYAPQIKNKNGIISDTSGWVEVSGEYTALGGEQYIIIGIFNDDVTIKHLTYSSTFEAYYYIDDITVIACNGIGVNEIKNEELQIKLYPNPNIGSMQIDYILKSEQTGMLIIYDLLGKKNAEYELKQGSSTLYINELILTSGIYFYKIFINNNLVTADKLIILNRP